MTLVSDRDSDPPIFLKLGLTHMNGWGCDAQNVEFNVKCTLPLIEGFTWSRRLFNLNEKIRKPSV